MVRILVNIFLYITTVLIWGSTWIAIPYQLGDVATEWSIAYRMILSAIALLIYNGFARPNMKFGLRAHVFFALTGISLFSFNYLLMYMATAYMSSGLVAITFSTITVMNILNGAIIYKTAIQARVLGGATIGLAGICAVFWPELDHLTFKDATFLGLALAFFGTALASYGNMASVWLQRAKIPVMQSNTWGLVYGSAFITLVAGLKTGAPTFEFTTSYILSLGYLSFFGTAIAFYTYLSLLGRIGASSAAYSTVMFPIIALGLSTAFEGYQWTAPAILGVVLVLGGNIVVLSGRKKAPAVPSRTL